jgi:hypothetical protein
MSSTNRTPLVRLPLFVDDDKPTWLGDVNDAMTLIDRQFVKTASDIADNDATVLALQQIDDSIDTRIAANAASIAGVVSNVAANTSNLTAVTNTVAGVSNTTAANTVAIATVKHATDSLGVYVPSTGVLTTDTAALQAAHDALSINGGTIRLDAGPYVISGVNFTKPVHLIGTGPHGVSADNVSSFMATGTVIQCPSLTAVCIAVNTDGCSFEKLSLTNTGSGVPTAGAGIQVATLGKNCRFTDCTFNRFWINLDIQNGYEWFITRCHFFDPVKIGIKLQDIIEDDGGDGIISDCFIFAGPTNLTPSDGISWHSGGGLKVIGTKVNGRGAGRFAVGINFSLGDGVFTSVALVTGCSIENTTYGIVVQEDLGSTTGNFSKFSFVCNEFSCTTNAIALTPINAGKIHGGVITGNVGSAGQSFFQIGGVDDVDIVGNKTSSGVTTIYWGGSPTATNIYLDHFMFTTANRPPASYMREGSRYYDTSLNTPAWANAGAWHNALGAVI